MILQASCPGPDHLQLLPYQNHVLGVLFQHVVQSLMPRRNQSLRARESALEVVCLPRQQIGEISHHLLHSHHKTGKPLLLRKQWADANTSKGSPGWRVRAVIQDLNVSINCVRPKT